MNQYDSVYMWQRGVARGKYWLSLTFLGYSVDNRSDYRRRGKCVGGIDDIAATVPIHQRRK